MIYMEMNKKGYIYTEATMQRKKRVYQNKIRDELNVLELQNSCEYWKYWNKLKSNNKMKSANLITLDCFEKYFSELQAPPAEFRSKFDMQFLKYAEEYIKNHDRHPQCNMYITDQPIMLHEVET